MFKKSFLFLLLLVALGLVISSNVSASEGTTVPLDRDKAFVDPLSGELIQPFNILEDGSVEMVSEEDYLAKIQYQLDYELAEEKMQLKEPLTNFITEPEIGIQNFYTYWRFARTGTRQKVIVARIKASRDITCTTPTCRGQVSSSATATQQFSTSISAERSAISAGAGYTWTRSSSASESFTFEGLVRGDQGYVGFSPYHWKVQGILSEYGSQGMGLIRSKDAWGSYPVVLSSGEVDGAFYFVYTKRG